MQRLLLLGAERHDRRTHPVDAHVLRAAWLVVCPHLLTDDGLVPHRTAASAVLDRPREREQALGREARAEPLRDREVVGVVGERAQEAGRDLGGDERSQLGAQGVGALAEVEVHHCHSGSRRSTNAARAFVGVGVGPVALHGVPTVGHPRTDDRSFERADDVARGVHGSGRGRGDRGRDLVGVREEAVGLQDLTDETELERASRVPALAAPAEREQGQRVQRNPHRERHRFDSAHLTDGDMGIREPRVVARDRDVGVGHEVQTATGAHAVDGCDHRNVDAAPRKERELVVDALARGSSLVVEITDVDARTERLALACDHDAADVVVLPDVGPELGELAADGPVECIALVGAIEGDREDVRGLLEANRGEGAAHRPLT